MIEGEYSGPLVDGVREGKSALLEWSNGDRYEVSFFLYTPYSLLFIIYYDRVLLKAV